MSTKSVRSRAISIGFQSLRIADAAARAREAQNKAAAARSPRRLR